MPHVLLLLCGHLTPISYLEGSTLHCSRVSLGSDCDMADAADLDLGLLPGGTGPCGAGAAGPAVEKEAAAAAMPAATKWDDWETRFRELYVQNLA